MKLPRLFVWLLVVVSLLGLIAGASPQQLPVVLYKAALVTGGVVLGYWLDRSLFHYARPHELFERAERLDSISMEHERAWSMRFNASLATLRRTVIILACVLGQTLGL